MDKKTMTKKTSDISFENAIARLEEIVRGLENGSVQLDQSLTMFEEGVGLVKLCNEKLDRAEQRIKVLYKKEDGDYGEKEFDESQHS